eukprot:GHRR01035994.1.p1 GENE.GHRR01035994.1~~GHRR01035994.1.p1  ORF type:complete len:129 (-),score=25.81 GHRR01035994.1:105-491(-)
MAPYPTMSKLLLPLALQVQLILPEALKLLPLYSLALQKSPLLRPDVRIDERSLWIATMVSASCPRTLGLLHPRLFAVHQLIVSFIALQYSAYAVCSSMCVFAFAACQYLPVGAVGVPRPCRSCCWAQY